MKPLIAQALAAHRSTPASLWWRRFLLLINLTPPIIIIWTGGTELWTWIYAIVIHHVLLAGLFIPRSRLLGPVLTKLPTEEKIVWLTIDDGPSPDTAAIANMLSDKGISATFFLRGKMLHQYPEALEAIRKNGHTVANHTQNHDLAWFWIFPPWKVRREVHEFQKLAAELDLPTIPAFRCPAGFKNPFLHSVLHRSKLTLTCWSVRAHDGIRCDPEKNTQRVLTRLKPGSIILVHEGKTNAANQPVSLDFIRNLVSQIRSAGYEFAKA